MSRDCCRVLAAKFDRARAGADLREYRAEGPPVTTLGLLDLIRRTGARDLTLLDVGSGIGILHAELIGSVVTRTTMVEASPAYLAVARAEAARAGTADRVELLEGDLAALEVPEADLVTLDRVICCDPAGEALVDAAAARARRFVALSYPRDRWYVRLVLAAENLVRRLRRNTFRMWVHAIPPIERLLAQRGFRPAGRRATFMWEMTLWERCPP